ncbi:MAG: tRNA (guanosine(37)-N1)-methyltransferase TrmD [Acidimicrobiales bacterium]
MTGGARVLVTGGAGFIGRHIVEALVASGRAVTVLDRAPAPVGMAASTRYVQGDLADGAAVDEAMAGATAVCHQAARVGLETAVADAAAYVVDNDLGTASLLGGMDRAGFGGRIVLASSMVVYGEGSYLCARHGQVRPHPRPAGRLAAGYFEPVCPICGAELASGTVTEDASTDPRNIYAATKLHQEHLCAVYARNRSVDLISLRYHNVYGPGMPRDTPYAGVAARFADRLHQGLAPLVHEDGGQRRDFVHVHDVARANLAALFAPPGVDGPMNVASGRPVTVLAMAEAICDVFGPEAPRPVVDGQYRLGDVRHIVASPYRARERLGFEARVALADGMAELFGGNGGPRKTSGPAGLGVEATVKGPSGEIHVLSVLPDLVRSGIEPGPLGRARRAGAVSIVVHDIRDHATDSHRSVDDRPFGGGPGMVLSAPPVFAAVDALAPPRPLILLDPAGVRFDQAVAVRLAALVERGDGFSLLCGRYEGVDERIRAHLVDEELSVGDFVLAGGEVAALVVIEAVTRLLPGVMGNPGSAQEESFTAGLLEYPQYTRPAVFRDWEVPAVLVSGDHGRVARWRRAEAEARTRARRPDLLGTPEALASPRIKPQSAE